MTPRGSRGGCWLERTALEELCGEAGRLLGPKHVGVPTGRNAMVRLAWEMRLFQSDLSIAIGGDDAHLNFLR